MTQTHTPVRMPTAVVGAILALVVAGLMFVAESFQNDLPLAFALVLAAVPWICAIGCWRGWIPILPVTVLLGGAMLYMGLTMMTSTNFFVRASSQAYGLVYLVIGVAIAGLVLIPKSSRDWFFLQH